MKGLLYKEWCLGKKTFIAFLALSLVFSILGILVFLSMICGNLKSWPSEEPESVKMLTYIFFYVPYILMLIAIEGCNQSIYMDYSSGWMQYSYTMPVKPHKAIGARYIMGALVMAFAFVYSLVNIGIICAFSAQDFTTNIVKNMLVILVLGICSFALMLPLALKLKVGRKVSSFLASFEVALYVVAGMFIVDIDKKYPETSTKVIMETVTKIRDIIVDWSLLIVVIVVTASFFASCKIYQRREL